MTIPLCNICHIFCNMATTRKWTFSEVKGFSEWDKKRKDGKLGAPVRFETVNELESWLHEQK